MTSKSPTRPKQTSLSINFLIVGGGVAGLACAIALRRVGHRVLVLEKEIRDEEVSGGCRIPPNLSKIFNHWGLEEQLLDTVAVTSECLRFHVYETGEYLGTHIWNEELFRETRGEFLFAHHGDLRRLLYDTAISYGAKIRRGAHVVNIDADNRTVTLATGQVLRADVVVAADGLSSIARRQLLEVEGKSDGDVQSNGLVMFNATIPKALIMRDPELRGLYEQKYLSHYVWFGDRHCALGYPTGGNADFALILYAPDDGTDLPWGKRVPSSRMLQMLGKSETRLRKLVKMATPALVRPLKDWPVPEDWVHESGRMVVIGEAAHPFTPSMIQSYAMAVEDGAVLAKLFSHLRREDQIGSFLWAFQDLRQGRVATLMRSDLMNVYYMSQPASEQSELRNQGYRDKEAAGINVLDDADDKTEELWSELMSIWAYDAEDEADNWWVEWGILRERANFISTMEALDCDVQVQVAQAVAQSSIC